MKELKIDIPQDIKAFVKEISDKSEGYDIYIAGGLLRDTYKGLTPKDLDIVVIPMTSGNTSLYIPAGCYINYNKTTDDVSEKSDMQQRGVKQLIGMFNHNLSTKEVQLIVYDKYLNYIQVMEDMDMNIVQVVWDARTDKVPATDAFVKGHEDKVIECLHEYDEVRQFFRYERMQKKFPSYQVVGKPDEPPKALKLSGSSARHSGSIDLGED